MVTIYLLLSFWGSKLIGYGNCCTFMLTVAKEGVISHRKHNESRVLVNDESGWKIVHVHKSPAWNAPYDQ
jgi:hypothetical protein